MAGQCSANEIQTELNEFIHFLGTHSQQGIWCASDYVSLHFKMMYVGQTPSNPQ